MGVFTRRPAGKTFPEPKPVPRWMIFLSECALFGIPVLLLILPFVPGVPDFGLADPLPAIIELAAVLVGVCGAGAACRAFVLGRHGADLRRFGARARKWYAAGANRSLWTYLALLGLWGVAFQLPRISGWGALVFAGTIVFCLGAAFALFTAGLIVAAGGERTPSGEGMPEWQDGGTVDDGEKRTEEGE